ncbi:MAG: hypothetical protein AAF466_11565 [Bacteroidota bacterium]
MKNEHKLMITLRGAARIAGTFFTIGTLLFLIQLALGQRLSIVFLGLAFIVIALLFNGICALLTLIDLIRKDRLESFCALCILLANLPVAMGYLYMLTYYI